MLTMKNGLVTIQNQAVMLEKAIETPSNIYWPNTRVCVDPDEINGTIYTLLTPQSPPIESRVSCDPDEN